MESNVSSFGYKTFASQFAVTQNIGNAEQQVIAAVKNNKVKLLHSLTANDKSLLEYRSLENQQTLLHFSSFFNSATCALYLLFKGVDHGQKDKEGKTIHQLCAYTGHLDVLRIIHEYWKMTKIKSLNQNFIAILTQFGFKRTDSKKGRLKVQVSKDRQAKFLKARDQITQNYNQYCLDYIKFLLSTYSLQNDSKAKNCLHFIAQNKYQRCLTTLEYMIKSFNLENLCIDPDLLMHLRQIQGLIDNDILIDPRQYEDSLDLMKDFILPEKISEAQQFRQKLINQEMNSMLQAKDRDGHTPIYIASKTGSASIVALLKKVEKQYMTESQTKNNAHQIIKVALNNSSREQMIDLCQASKQADVKIMNFLISCGQQINKKKTIFGTFALLQSVKAFSKSQNIQPFKILLTSGADVNEQDTNGWTLFHHVAQKGNSAILKHIFLERDAKRIGKLKINKTTNKGLHPLHIAAMNNHLQVVELLIDPENVKKYEILENPLDQEKVTLLHYAAKKGSLKSLKRILEIKEGTDFAHCVDVNGNTCLHTAAANNQYECVRELLYFDSDKDHMIKIRNKKGNLARDLLLNKSCFDNIFTAARNGNVNLIRNLLNEKKQLLDSTTPKMKRTPLILSVMQLKLVNVKFLVESGACTYHQDQTQKSAVQYAQELEAKLAKSDKAKLPLIKKIKALLE